MDMASIALLALIAPVFVLIVYIMTKAVARNKIPDSRYTPIDQITGQSTVVFQEQKEDKEERQEKGDDADKNEGKP